MKKQNIKILSLIVIVFLISCSKSTTPTSPNPSPTKIKYGKLEITINGLTVNQLANLSITGPKSHSLNSSGHTIIDSVVVGVYTITTNFIIDANSDTILTSMPTKTTEVMEDSTSSVDFNFVPQQSQLYGSLNISFTGLPESTSGLVKLFDSEYTFIQNITDAIQIDSLEVGSYYLICSPILASNDRDFNPTVDTIFANITNGIVTFKTIGYKAGFYYEVFGRYNLASVKTSVGASLDGVTFNDANSNADPATAVEYTANGCALISYNYEDGYVKAASASAGGGSASINQSLTNTRSSKTITFSTSAAINCPAPSANTFGIITVNAQNNPYPFVIQFENPDRDSVVVSFTWSASNSASASATDNGRAGTQSQSAMYIHTSSCFSNLFSTSVPFTFSTYASSNGTSNPSSGQVEVSFKSQFYLVGIDLYTRAWGNSYFENTGGSGDGSGGGSADLSVTITATIQKY